MTDEEVWAQLEADATFQEEMEKAEADFRAGRMYKMVGGDFIPNPDWPLDDPIQPIGWHREAGKWVKDDEGTAV